MVNFRAVALAPMLCFASTLFPVAAFADINTYVPYDPSAPISNFSGPVASTNGVAYNITFGSDGTTIYGTLTPDPSSPGPNAGEFANLYFGTGADYNTGAVFGIEVTNNRAFIPGVPGFQDLTGTGYTYSVNNTTGAISFSLPFSYLFDPSHENAGGAVSAANPNVMLRDTQSFGYAYVGGPSDFGAGAGERFGTVTYSAVTPEPSVWGLRALLAVGLVSLTVVLRRRHSASVS
jgi:hypothetical protein